MKYLYFSELINFMSSFCHLLGLLGYR